MNFDLYVITDEIIGKGRTHAEIARLAIAGGADAIQLRDKSCAGSKLERIGRDIREITRRSSTLFIVNDCLDVALACEADGVHLGQGDLGTAVARQHAPSGFIIGVSVSTVEEACRAVEEGADYVALSPTFSTGSKPDAGPGHGLAMLRAIRQTVAVPVIAIGGINRENIPAVIAAGADGVAVISAVAGAPDITAAARDLKNLVLQSKAARR
ncbi:MAG: thiamine phosphate synthase [Methanomicrobiales archaeon HGW-Methanomicrobiales-1]|jgi:thiamine-phosphate pyrophosphorylase|nr:MAG: thiamine phosphate synthase [Methanomicrobiales archaeon HGW-Methanomicrobiales-1]